MNPFQYITKKRNSPKNTEKYTFKSRSKNRRKIQENAVCVCECMCECVVPSSRPRTIPFKWQESEKSTYQFSKVFPCQSASPMTRHK